MRRVTGLVKCVSVIVMSKECMNYILKSTCDCGTLEENFVYICETHYSEHMNYPMECDLITTRDYGMKIFEEFDIRLKNVRDKQL